MTDPNPDLTADLEAQIKLIEREPEPTRWDRASWLRGAIYALAWVIHRRGAALTPLEAAKLYVPLESPGDQK